MRETIPFYLQKFEKIVADNHGYSVGNNVSTLTTKIIILDSCKCKEFHIKVINNKLE